MSVKNVTVIDLALIELLSGETAAPSAVLDKLRARGLIATVGGRSQLTPKGRRRAEALRPHEHDMRLMAGDAAGWSGVSVRTVGGCGLHVGGGRAFIRR